MTDPAAVEQRAAESVAQIRASLDALVQGMHGLLDEIQATAARLSPPPGQEENGD